MSEEKPLTMMQQRRETAKKQKREIAAKLNRRERPVKPTPGTSEWRILLTEDAMTDATIPVGHSWGQHFIRNKKDELVAIHMCDYATYGKDCDICKAIEEGILNTSEGDKTRELLASAKAQNRYIMNALHLDGEDPSKPVLLDLTATTYEKLIDLIDAWGSEKYGETDIVSLEKGHDVTIKRTGAGINTKYEIIVSPVEGKVISEKIVPQLHNLVEYVDQPHSPTMSKALLAISGIANTTPALSAPDDDIDDVLDGEFEEMEAPKKISKDKAAEADAEAIKIDESEIDDILGDLEELEL